MTRVFILELGAIIGRLELAGTLQPLRLMDVQLLGEEKSAEQPRA